MTASPTPAPATPFALERLEPRALLTVWTPVDISTILDLSSLIRDAAPPTINASQNQFGYAVAAIGDINGDGAADFAVSAPGNQDGAGAWIGDPGALYLYSGANLALIRTIDDGFAGFGAAIINVGDANGDGVSDFAIGSPAFDDAPDDGDASLHGRVTLYSGVTFGAIRTLTGNAGAELGWALSTAGDVNGDGLADILVGAPGANRAFVYSGANGAILRTFTGENPGDRFGHAVVGGVDVPETQDSNIGDGFVDFFIGAPENDEGGTGAGRAYYYSAALSIPRYTFTGAEAGERLGSSVAIVGMTNASSGFLVRFLVGAPGADVGSGAATLADAGLVHRFTFSGVTDGLAPTIPGTVANQGLGEAIILPGGPTSLLQAPEFAVRSENPGAGAPRLRFFAGLTTGAYEIYQNSIISSAYSIAQLGDADGDGVLDVIAGFPVADGASLPARVVPLTAFAFPPGLIAASDNGAYAIFSSGAQQDGSVAGYLISNGVTTSFADIPGLTDLEGRVRLLAVNDSGLIFGTTIVNETSPNYALSEYFFLFNGVRTNFSAAIAAFDGGQPTSLDFIKLADTGDVLLQHSSSTDPQAYLFRGGRLVHLWAGTVSDVNDAGIVVGTREGPGINQIGVCLNAAGVVADLVGLENAGAIDELNQIVGWGASGNLAMWQAGQVTDLITTDLSEGATLVRWDALDIDDDSRVLARVTYAPFTPGRPTGTQSLTYLYTPATEDAAATTEFVDDVITGDPFVENGIPARFLDYGRALAGGRLVAVPFILDPVTGDSPNSSTAAQGGQFVVSITQDGDVIILRRDSLGYVAQQLVAPESAQSPLGAPDDVLVYTDPRDGRAYAVSRYSDQLFWFGQDWEGEFDDLNPLHELSDDRITHNLTTFTSADGRVHLAGTDAQGDVLIIYQHNTPGAASNSINNWSLDNLSREHITDMGFVAPQFASELTAYATPWNGMNIAGLDTQGDIHVLWWAPGIEGGFWQTENLTDNSGSPKLAGRLSAFVTPWSAIHIMGTSTEGDLIATWWVPQFGQQWTFSNLTTEYDGLKLNPDHITTYITSWGGLNIAGRDDDSGRMAVYWWSPEADTWTSELLDIEPSDEAFLPAGNIVGLVAGNSLNLYSSTLDGALVRFFWNVGDGGPWSTEQVITPA
ncbi:MAG: FG-GAP repeat protein [Phycisphaerales bacterium]|nr:FG-GAP repeat protein [Phycisphaerales bacterium]